MSAKSKKNAAQKPAPAKPSPGAAAAVPMPAAAAPAAAVTADTTEPFYKRHPKVANVIFAALCVYVAMLWLLALDQTFHWGIFGPKVPLVP